MDEDIKASSALRREAIRPIRWKRLPSQGPLAGVCAGLARYLRWKPWKLRAALVLSTLLFAGAPILVYALAATIVPADPARTA